MIFLSSATKSAGSTAEENIKMKITQHKEEIILGKLCRVKFVSDPKGEHYHRSGYFHCHFNFAIFVVGKGKRK